MGTSSREVITPLCEFKHQDGRDKMHDFGQRERERAFESILEKNESLPSIVFVLFFFVFFCFCDISSLTHLAAAAEGTPQMPLEHTT